MYDYLIVGAGLYGSVFAEQKTKQGCKVLVIDQRDHIGGNCYTRDVDGIHVHHYGPHIFHTNDKRVWDYIRQFAEFNHYTHRVKANYEGKIYSLPVNLMTFNQLWGIDNPNDAMQKLESVKRDFPKPANMEEWLLSQLGQEIYEKFFYGYSTKHWRKSPKELPASVGKRLPIRTHYDDNYFDDKYQGIPIGGYTQIFEKMLDGIEVKLSTPLEDGWRSYAKKMVFTGRPDLLLKNKYGELPYLTLKFEEERKLGSHQGLAQLNFTSIDVPYTRCVEHKFFEYKEYDHTVITREYPVDWYEGATPFYPVKDVDGKNQIQFQKYREEILSKGDIILGGRLGSNSYMDMDTTIGQALVFANRELH